MHKKTHIIIEDGKKVSAALPLQEAEDEAKRRNQQKPKDVPENKKAAVKQVIMG